MQSAYEGLANKFAPVRYNVVAARGLTPQPKCVTVRYTDDTGRYEEDVCNRLPGAVVEYPIAEMVESDVEDGDIGVIETCMENGSSLDWIARWNKAEKYGDSVTIFPRPGVELANGTVYTIQIKVSDVAGNKVYEEIMFATKQRNNC